MVVPLLPIGKKWFPFFQSPFFVCQLKMSAPQQNNPRSAPEYILILLCINYKHPSLTDSVIFAHTHDLSWYF